MDRGLVSWCGRPVGKKWIQRGSGHSYTMICIHKETWAISYSLCTRGLQFGFLLVHIMELSPYEFSKQKNFPHVSSKQKKGINVFNSKIRLIFFSIKGEESLFRVAHFVVPCVPLGFFLPLIHFVVLLLVPWDRFSIDRHYMSMASTKGFGKLTHRSWMGRNEVCLGYYFNLRVVVIERRRGLDGPLNSPLHRKLDHLPNFRFRLNLMVIF